MTATVATVASGKGGAGKTTTTANLPVALALAGQKGVCIDGDIGLRNLDVVLDLENRIMTQEGSEHRLVADIPLKVTRRRRSGES